MTFNAQFYPFLGSVDRGGFIIFPTGQVLLQRFPGGCNKWGEEEYPSKTFYPLSNVVTQFDSGDGKVKQEISLVKSKTRQVTILWVDNVW